MAGGHLGRAVGTVVLGQLQHHGCNSNGSSTNHRGGSPRLGEHQGEAGRG